MAVARFKVTSEIFVFFSIVVGLLLITMPTVMFPDPSIGRFVNALGAFVIIIPVFTSLFINHRITLGKNINFVLFLQNISTSISKGISFEEAIVTASRKSYGPLTEDLRNFYGELSSGMSMKDALNNFSKDVGSNLVKRATRAMVDMLEVGNLTKALPELVTGLIKQKEIKRKEGIIREKSILKLYLMFMVFLAISVSMVRILIPLWVPETSVIAADICNLKIIAIFFIIIQSLFGGLVAGKLVEKHALSWIKHAITQLAIASIFLQIFLGMPFIDMFLMPMGLVSPEAFCAL